MILSKILLFPYYITLKIRNRLYDKGKMKTYSWDTPVICIGNVTAGGTGKTPMTEYAVKLYSQHCRVAVLSMGYKRKGKGFMLVKPEDTADMVGDEPLQIKRKFPNVTVAIDRNRKRGIDNLLALVDKPDVILLDDAFQRREIIPSKTIFLVDYNRPIFKDQLLPLGHLRDLPEQIRRADAVVVTKFPEYHSEWDCEKLRKLTRIKPGQEIYFSKIRYCQPKPVFEQYGDNRYIYSKSAYLFTGVANPRPLQEWLCGSYDEIATAKFQDHHKYTAADIFRIRVYAEKNPLCILLTTEKDAQRLRNNRFITEAMKVRMFYVPIEVEFLNGDETKRFNDYLLEN